MILMSALSCATKIHHPPHLNFLLHKTVVSGYTLRINITESYQDFVVNLPQMKSQEIETVLQYLMAKQLLQSLDADIPKTKSQRNDVLFA